MSLYNVDLEKAVIATLLTVDNAFDHIETELLPTDFYAGRHQEIYKIITQLRHENMPYDSLMVMNHIEANNMDHLTGGEEYLSELIISTPATTFNLGYYTDRIRDLAQRRAINTQLMEGQKVINNTEILPTDAWSDISESINTVLLGAQGETYSELGDLTKEFLDYLQDMAINGVKAGIPTGLTELDNKLTVDKGSMCVIAARPSMGKTTLLQNILKHISETQEGRAVFFSLEMPKIDIYKRMASNQASIHMSKIFTDAGLNEDEWQRLMANINFLENSNSIIDDRSALTVGQMRATLNRVRQRHGKVSAIFVDYIQLMKCTDRNVKNRTEEVGSISGGLKGLAKEFNCPIFVLSQLNRSLENRPDKRPIMSDLRESGAIEQDADQIIFIYRDEVYNENTQDKGVAELIIAKQRNGPIGKVRVGFEGHYGRFTDLIPTYPEDEDVFGGGQ